MRSIPPTPYTLGVLVVTLVECVASVVASAASGWTYLAFLRKRRADAQRVLDDLATPAPAQLKSGRVKLVGTVRARKRASKEAGSPIRGRLAEELKTIGKSTTWVVTERELEGESFDLQLIGSDEVVRVDLGKRSQWALHAAPVVARRTWSVADTEIELLDGERVVVDGDLTERAMKKAPAGYRGSATRSWALRSTTAPLLIRCASAAQAYRETRFLPASLALMAIALVALNLGLVAQLALFESSMATGNGSANIATEQRSGKRGRYEVTVLNAVYVKADGRSAGCPGLAVDGHKQGDPVLIRYSTIDPDYCYVAGHHERTGRMELTHAVALLVLTSITISLLLIRSSGRWWFSRPWFERIGR